MGPWPGRRRAIRSSPSRHRCRLGAAHHPSPILHHRVIGAVVVSRWVQVEPDVAQLGFQLRVGGELECLDPVRRDSTCARCRATEANQYSQPLSHQPRRPVRRPEMLPGVCPACSAAGRRRRDPRWWRCENPRRRRIMSHAAVCTRLDGREPRARMKSHLKVSTPPSASISSAGTCQATAACDCG